MSDQLTKLQQQIQAYIFSPDNKQTATTLVTDPERLEIYVDMYRERLSEMLRQEFPATQGLIGEQDFETIINEYISAHPSREAIIDNFPQFFPAFIQEKTIAHDMACFEWAMSKAMSVADIETLDQQDLVAIPQEQWPELTFSFHPSLQLIYTPFNLIEIWLAHRDQQTIPVSSHSDEPSLIIVWRQGIEIQFRQLESMQQLCLESAIAGDKFATLCEHLSGHMDEAEVAQTAINELVTWLGSELLISIC